VISRDHDPAPVRWVATSQRAEDVARSVWQIGERRRRRREGPPVAPRVGDQEDHILGPAVATLESEAAFEGLEG
jgi:hypothetical protein